MLKFSRHAIERMNQRGFNKEDVENCLQNYHSSFTDVKGKTTYRAKAKDGRNIRIVTTPDGPNTLIITVAEEGGY